MSENRTPSSSITSNCCKDPKLASPLAELTRVAAASQTPSVFSEESLPRGIRDGMRAGRIRITSNGEIQVYVELDEISSEKMQILRGLGAKLQIIGKPGPDKARGEVLMAVPTIQAALPIDKIEQIERLEFVRYIRLPDYGFASTGSVDSQGDNILRAQAARSTLGIDGTGVKIGVISSGIGGVFATGCTACGPTAAIPSPIALNDLPAALGTRDSNAVLISVTGGITARSFRADNDLEDSAVGANGAEGTALLEIIHDLAPGSPLSFANADTQMAFEQAVDFLAESSDIVVDDIYFLTPPFDGTSAVSANTANALNNNANNIRGYFTAVGNFAQDHYQGQYLNSGIDGAANTGEIGSLHQFQAVPGSTTDQNKFGPATFDPLASVPPGGTVSVFLGWDDPQGASSNNYDLFLVPLTCASQQSGLPAPPCSVSGPFLASSTNPQTGTQDPTENLTWTNQTGSAASVGIVIQNVKNQAAVRTFDIFIQNKQAKSSMPNHNFNTIPGSVPAEGDAGGSPVSVISVGAIDQTQCLVPENCLGSAEPYSSQGPTEATPQTQSRIKPDLLATDDVCITGAGGFGHGAANSCSPAEPTSYTPQLFRGTSAATPHVAAIAALILQSAPCLLSNSSIPQTALKARMNLRNALINTAIPLPSELLAIPNNEQGNGLVDALGATKSMLPTASSGISQTVNVTSNNGASVVLAGNGTDPNSCPLSAVQWAGDCGTGIVNGLHANLMCPIGVNTVRLGISNNGLSFSPPAPVPFTVVVTDFSVSASAQNTMIEPGTPANYTVAVASTADGPFSNSVALACSSGLPVGAVCTFSPVSVVPSATATPSNSGAVSILTISAPFAGSLAFHDVRTSPPLKLYRAWCTLLMLTVFLTISFGIARKKPAFHWLLVISFLFALLAIPGCNSNNPSMIPTKTYMVTITGTSNQLQHSTTVSLVAQ